MQRHRAGESLMFDASDYGRKAVDDAIEEWVIGRNGERDRIIMRLHLFDGITFQEMQKRLDKTGYPLSIDRLKQIINRRLPQIQKHIKNQ